MKKLLAVLLLAPALALAQNTTYRAKNQNGGEIVLTDRQCPHKDGAKLKYGYSYATGGKTLKFCWVPVDGMVRVVYLDDGAEYTYPTEIFYKVEK